MSEKGDTNSDRSDNRCANIHARGEEEEEEEDLIENAMDEIDNCEEHEEEEEEHVVPREEADETSGGQNDIIDLQDPTAQGITHNIHLQGDEEQEEVIAQPRQCKEKSDGKTDGVVKGSTSHGVAQHFTLKSTTKDDKETLKMKKSQLIIPTSRRRRRTQKDLESKNRPANQIVLPLPNGRGLRKNCHHTNRSHHTDEIHCTNDSPTPTIKVVDETNDSSPANDSIPGATGNVEEEYIIPSSTRSLVDVRDDNHHHHNNTSNSTHLIQAYAVADDEQQISTEISAEIRADIQAQVEREVRQSIIQGAVEANVVEPSFLLHWSSTAGERKTLWLTGCVGLSLLLLLLLLVVVVLSIVFAVILPNNDKESGNNNIRETDPIMKSSTLDMIRERGFIRYEQERITIRCDGNECGTYEDSFGFSLPNPTTGQRVGMNPDHCRAIAIAVFNNSNAVEFVTINTANRFQQLADEKVDVVATTATHNFQRDVYFGKSTDSGFTFSKPFVYSGLAFWGPPDFLHCAETLDAETGICKNLTICVAALTTHEFLLRTLLPQQALISYSSIESLISNFDDGICQTLAAEIFYTNSTMLPASGGTSGTKLFSNEPLSLVTRENDREWSNLVNSVVNVFFLAEANGISKDNAEDLQPLVGPILSPMLVPIIQELGNYADLYKLHLEALVPRHGLNTLYTKNDQSGLLYVFPLGISSGKGPEPDPDGMIARVLDRGHLKCGVVVANDRNAAMAGFDTELCKALSAGLFGGSTEAVEVTEISATDAAFKALDDGEWDVAAGMRLHLLAGYREPKTGKGFSLSMPYYYDTIAMQAYGFVTTADDPKWSDLVNWVAMATIHAASKGIGQSAADQMPKVSLFGKNLNLFQDVVRGVGSYNEIYNRTLEAFIPQAGSGNELNHNLTGPQQFPLPFL